MSEPLRAFVLGAGLGTRLKKLTEVLPKPLIPVWNRPLITHAFAHLRAAGVREFIVNTHHLPETYAKYFPNNEWDGLSLTFRHEPILLETGGGLANVADLLSSAPFLVYNGDILSDLPLAPLLQRHRESGNLVTLLLRSGGTTKNVAFDVNSGLVVDLRQTLGRTDCPQFQFTGIYMVEPRFLTRLAYGQKASVVPAFLAAIQDGDKIGGLVMDEGDWQDLGDRESYLHACASWKERHPELAEPNIDPAAQVHPSADIDEHTSVGPHAIIESGAVLRNSIIWPNASVAANTRLTRCIVRSGRTARDHLENADI